jgi:hypothetical protein
LRLPEAFAMDLFSGVSVISSVDGSAYMADVGDSQCMDLSWPPASDGTIGACDAQR